MGERTMMISYCSIDLRGTDYLALCRMRDGSLVFPVKGNGMFKRVMFDF